MRKLQDLPSVINATTKLDDLKTRAKFLRERIDHWYRQRGNSDALTQAAEAMLEGRASTSKPPLVADMESQFQIVTRAIDMQQGVLNNLTTEAALELWDSEYSDLAKKNAARTTKAAEALLLALDAEGELYVAARRGGAVLPAHAVIRPQLQALVRGGYPTTSPNHPLRGAIMAMRKYWQLTDK